ncbi:hypothetical protein KRX57_00375 [Weeksellaceae bacterium TAE3-ERU29]|nr:hypothetical protein [Weeksellaceae bacterium TAE3-ERU29]
MKKYIIIASLLGLVFSSKAQAQIRTNAAVDAAINNQNPFLDASSQSLFSNIGKGIVFPRTNLTTFKFKTDLIDGSGTYFPTAFDGMLVYNTHVEENATIDDPATGSYTLDLKEGFYYFSNPNGDTSGNLAGGRWKPLGSGANISSIYSQNGTLSGDREVNLDNHNLNFIGGNVGMNTTKPKATLDIEAVPNADTNGILIPRLSSAQRSAFVNPEKGLMIYNTELECYETNTGTPVEPRWQCLATAENVQTLSIEPLGFEGNFKYASTNYPSKHKVVFKVTNNTSSELTGLDLSYIYVQGNTQYIAEGQNDNVTIPANSSKILKYGISGQNWGEYSTFTLKYDQYSSATIRLNPDRSGYSETGISKGNGGTADIGEMKLELFLVKDTGIDKTVTITADNPLKVKIPFTKGEGNYLGYESELITLNDAEGNPRQIQLKYGGGNLDIKTGEIEAEIVSVDGNDFALPQTTLGVNTTIAQIPVKLNDTDKGTFDLIAYGGIPDRNYNRDDKHKFVYMPIQSPSGRIWLNNNLGAEYSNINSEFFNPQQQAQSLTDIYARGSAFQMRRAADGHELTTVENEEIVFKEEEVVATADDFYPNSSKIFKNPKSRYPTPFKDRIYTWMDAPYKWSHNEEWLGLWLINGANNPCPEGFRPPSSAEIEEEIRYLKTINKKGLYESLKLVVGIWTNDGRAVTMNPSTVFLGYSGEQSQIPVRCIKHEN